MVSRKIHHMVPPKKLDWNKKNVGEDGGIK